VVKVISLAKKTDKKMGFCIKRHKIILMNCMDYNYFFSKMIIQENNSCKIICLSLIFTKILSNFSRKVDFL